jgi:DNA repair protein RecO (recombination protein O)
VIRTDAIVLHAFDYRETSRIVRLATREAGVVSVIARGAKRTGGKFGQGMDLFTSGAAQIVLHPTRDLHTLSAFDATRARPGLAASLARFGAAAALSELGMRCAPEDGGGAIHDVLVAGFDAVSVAEAHEVIPRTVSAAWHLAEALGFAPTLEHCAACHEALDREESVRFAPRAGGALCARCAALAPGARALPADARAMVLAWAAGEEGIPADAKVARAHQRLVREFLEEHLADGKPLRAWRDWEMNGGHPESR